MKPQQRTRTLFAVLALSLHAALGAASASAASVSYYLDQSNGLPDGTNYLMVTISDGSGGLIDFTVETLSPLSSIAGPNFGIEVFGFNTTLASLPGDSALVSLPTGWSGNVAPPPNVDDGFGQFEFEVSGSGATRQTTLSFSVDVAGDSILDYYELSGGVAGEGNVQFAALVGGFDTQSCASGPCSSAWFGGGPPVPEADTYAMLLAGLGVVGFAARRKLGKRA